MKIQSAKVIVTCPGRNFVTLKIDSGEGVWGVDIDEALAAKFPYRPAYPPVNRLADGTLWNW